MHANILSNLRFMGPFSFLFVRLPGLDLVIKSEMDRSGSYRKRVQSSKQKIYTGAVFPMGKNGTGVFLSRGNSILGPLYGGRCNPDRSGFPGRRWLMRGVKSTHQHRFRLCSSTLNHTRKGIIGFSVIH